jgi:hypothetical protein
MAFVQDLSGGKRCRGRPKGVWQGKNSKIQPGAKVNNYQVYFNIKHH